MSFKSPSGRELQPPKGLRRGTHSCLECRRRKIRCILVSDEQACQSCILRGSECLDQENKLPKAETAQRKRQRYRKRVELGGIVSDLLQRLAPGLDEAPCTKSEIALVEALERFQSELPLPGRTAEHQPLRTSLVLHSSPYGVDCLSTHREGLDTVPLVNLLTRRTHLEEDIAAAAATTRPSPGLKCSQAVETLRAIVPRRNDLTLILKNGQRGWSVWQKAFPKIQGTGMDYLGPNQIRDLQSYIELVLSTDEVAVIAKILLCVALCIQQLPSNIGLLQTSLQASAEELEAQYLAPIESYFATNDRCACTVEGLQCILIQTRIYINAGKPHKAWLLFRRGVDIAHLLGLHRPTREITSEISRYKRSLWVQIWQGERYLSLLLGFPYTASDKQLALNAPQAQNQDGHDIELVQIQLGVVAGSLIDRDQAANRMSVAATMRIEEDLEQCQKSFPKDYWDPTPGSEMSLQTMSDMLAAKFTIYNLRKLLFLPFILQDENKYDFARVAALDASREMIKLYHVMRDINKPLLSVCNMADFQVFTAAMVLVMDLLGSRRQEEIQIESDWQIIHSLTLVLKRVSVENPKSAATHAAQILVDIYELRLRPRADSEQLYEAYIPYFGKLTLNLNKPVELQSSSGTLSDDAKSSRDAAKATTSTSPIYNQDFDFESYLSLSENDLTMDWTSNVDFNLCDDWIGFLDNEAFS